MPDLPQLLLFIAAGWLLNLTPGPDVLCIVSTSLRQGARAGMVAALGIFAGCFVHVAVATVGLGALLAASATAFTVVKVIGAAYLMWMGWRLLRSQPGQWRPDAAAETVPLQRVFWRGFLTNVLNPKVALFFLAFLPQFIVPGAEHQTLAFWLLGLLFSLNSLIFCLLFVAAGAWLGRRLGGLQRLWPRIDRGAAILFVGFGLKLALSEPPGR